MKKVTVFILTFILFIPIVNGKNINDLYGELNALENQKNLYSYLNSEDIKSLSNNGLDIQIIIDSLNDEINELDKEITSKEEFINSLKEEIDNVMVYNQVSQGENIYLEYIFAAETYSDMVYRYMIAEQISNYNNTVIEEMNKEIEELNKKKEELNEKINKLDKERSKYRELEVILKSVSYLDGDSIILKKFSQIESLESISVDYVEAFNQIIKHNIIVTDRDKVVAVSGPLKKKYLGKNINEFTERSIERRDSFSEKQKKEFKIIEDEEDVGYYTFASIVNNGDAIGSVILISLDTPLSDTEDKLAIVLSNLLSKQFID